MKVVHYQSRRHAGRILKYKCIYMLSVLHVSYTKLRHEVALDDIGYMIDNLSLFIYHFILELSTNVAIFFMLTS